MCNGILCVSVYVCEGEGNVCERESAVCGEKLLLIINQLL